MDYRQMLENEKSLDAVVTAMDTGSTVAPAKPLNMFSAKNR